jgi:hypothetical protein
MVQNGPAKNRVRSNTLKPLSGLPPAIPTSHFPNSYQSYSELWQLDKQQKLHAALIFYCFSRPSNADSVQAAVRPLAEND